MIHFLPRLKGKAVKVWSDNMTALACIRRQGSAHSPALLELASSLLILCHRHNITLIPSHIQGVLNVLADAGSRRGPIATEWSLDPHSFKEICHLWGRPQLDLFATRYNTQLWTFVSPCPDPAALCMDAMAWDWNVWQSVYLSPSADASTGSFKVRRFLGDRVRDSALLALPGLVRHVGTQSSLLHSPTSPTLPVPIYNSGTRVLPQHFHLEPSRMEAITKPLKLQGWSNNSLRCAQAEHKDTTQGSYQRIWSRFLTFLDNQRIPHR